MVAAGRVPDRPLAPVVAYLDWRNFGVLPHAGGAFDQPAGLMDELRYVAGVVADADRDRKRREQG